MLFTALLLAAASPCSTAVTQGAMTACAGDDYRRADAAMTRQWQATYAYMKRRDAQETSRGGGPGYAAALLAAQRAWLAYRDANCVVAGLEMAGGSAQPMAMAQCKTDLTRARTQQLRAQVWSG